MWNKIKSFFTNDIGIDLGTANTLVFAKDRGIVYRQPSVVAIQAKTRKVLAVGEDARLMLGRTPGSIIASRPMKQGVIADPDITQELLRDCITKSRAHRHKFRAPRAVIAVPGDISQVERTAVREAALHAGARQVVIVQEPKAAALGIGLPIWNPEACMIIDIGGGTTDVALLALGDIVYAKSVRVGGDDMDEAIMNYMRNRYNLIIGPRTAEEVKIKLGSAYKLEQELTAEVKGRDQVKGRPLTLEITSQEIREEALNDVIQKIVDTVAECLENAPAEHSSDLVDRGMWLAGGGSQLTGIDRRISEATLLPVHLADDPLSAVAEGAGIMLDVMSRSKISMAEEDRNP